MDKAKGGKIEDKKRGWVGRGKVVVGKWTQLYLNNNKFFKYSLRKET